MPYGPMLPDSAVEGGRVVSIEIWGPIVVEKDGELFEIHIVEGHDGPENIVYRARQYRT